MCLDISVCKVKALYFILEQTIIMLKTLKVNDIRISKRDSKTVFFFLKTIFSDLGCFIMTYVTGKMYWYV